MAGDVKGIYFLKRILTPDAHNLKKILLAVLNL